MMKHTIRVVLLLIFASVINVEMKGFEASSFAFPENESRSINKLRSISKDLVRYLDKTYHSRKIPSSLIIVLIAFNTSSLVLDVSVDVKRLMNLFFHDSCDLTIFLLYEQSLLNFNSFVK